MKYFSRILVMVVFFLVGTSVYADRGCRLRDDMDRIMERIDRGIEDGTLTAGEAQRLQREYDSTWELHNELREDGYMSGNDCEIMRDRVYRLSDQVRRLKRNSRDRYYDREWVRSYRFPYRDHRSDW